MSKRDMAQLLVDFFDFVEHSLPVQPPLNSVEALASLLTLALTAPSHEQSLLAMAAADRYVELESIGATDREAAKMLALSNVVPDESVRIGHAIAPGWN